MRKRGFAFIMGLLVLLSLTAMATTGRYDEQIQQAVSQKIHGTKHLQSVNSSVEDGIVTLTGSVNLYQDKLDAANKIKKFDNVTGVRNDIVVAGATVSDDQLQKKLTKQIAYDRVGYYDNTFNYIAINVKDGVVTLDGDTVYDVPKDSALAIVARTAGVKDVVNDVSVLPVSRFDDSIRTLTARAIYRDSVLGRYASDPAHPIRIVVDNGHVTLYGTVENTMDKTIAGIRANSVPGAFSVENKLIVD
ncbi:MAG TPA: BON domain-containing protein [Terriglobales bacterium]|jgi:hyperosmotically inducible protein|nr:BON domain-containing protein [Terriglobales bacterium]